MKTRHVKDKEPKSEYVITMLICKGFSFNEQMINIQDIYMRQEVKLTYRKGYRMPLFEDFGAHVCQSVEKYLDVVGT